MTPLMTALQYSAWIGSIGSLLCSGDVSLASGMQRGGCGHDDRHRHQVAARHTEPHVDANALKCCRCLAGHPRQHLALGLLV